MLGKPRRFGDVCGSARSQGEKIQLESRRGVVGEKKFKKLPRQETGQELLQIFS